jgi:hypothetical protein
MWEDVLKRSDGVNEQGKHVTKMYMFLKRYFSDTHTPQFKELYILQEELEPRALEHVKSIITRLLTSNRQDMRMVFPGIKSFSPTGEFIQIEFDDALHIKHRDEHIENSSTSQKYNAHYKNNYRPWWVGKPPYDSDIQIQWLRFADIIKKSSPRNRRMAWQKEYGY